MRGKVGRWRLPLAVFLVAAVAITVAYYRLALLPTGAIAATVRRNAGDVPGLDSVKDALAKHYPLRGSGAWRAPRSASEWGPDAMTVSGEGYSCIRVLVGQYHVPPIQVSVEAVVVLDSLGHVVHVAVRRTNETL